MPRQQTGVAIDLIDDPRTDHPGITPPRLAFPLCDARTDIAESAVRILCIVNIDQPLGEERCNIGIIGRRAREHLGVPHPAESFIALRTVGGDAQVVAPLAPYDVGIELVDTRIGAGKLTR